VQNPHSPMREMLAQYPQKEIFARVEGAVASGQIVPDAHKRPNKAAAQARKALPLHCEPFGRIDPPFGPAGLRKFRLFTPYSVNALGNADTAEKPPCSAGETVTQRVDAVSRAELSNRSAAYQAPAPQAEPQTRRPPSGYRFSPQPDEDVRAFFADSHATP